MDNMLLVLLLIGLAAAAVTALWNATEARRLAQSREVAEDAIENMRAVINGNADVLVETAQFAHRLSNSVSELQAKSDLYALALSIRSDYPKPSETFEVDIFKLD